MQSMRSTYFAYGSNMNFEQMQTRCPGSVFLMPATLMRWRYFINSDGYAGIKKDDNSETYGCLWQLSEIHWQALDRYEGVREGCYRRSQLNVIAGANKTGKTVTGYLSNDESYGVPSKPYQSGVLRGAHQVGLPEHYINMLESWEKGYSLDLGK